MKTKIFLTVSAIALASLPAAAAAQHQNHSAPPAEQPAAEPAADHGQMDHSQMDHGQPAAEQPAPAPAPSEPAPAAEQPAMDHGQMDQSQMNHSQPAAEQPQAGQMDHSQMDHGQMDHSQMAGGHDMAGHKGALGPYPMNREASGTAWQPDLSEHMGVMRQAGDWMLMGHGVLNVVGDHQSGRRGDDKLFLSGMLMGMAQRPIGNGTVQFKGMLSPDPLMGKSGYPLLLASGETANGVDLLIDRQHPHDFFMELSASVSQNIGTNSSVFLYGGLPGEPAFGPPAFMHREAIMDSPEAPISHHWLDSTHISFGVLTAGLVLDKAKIEISRFNGREPDQYRWNIETAPLDSTAVRLSYNPTPSIALQGSWGYFKEPEQLEEGDQRRFSASALWADQIAPEWKAAATLAWGRKGIQDHDEWLYDDAFVAEGSLKHRGWTFFGRGEITENRELVEDEHHGEAYRVGKASIGAVRDFRIAENVSFGAGALVSVNFVPGDLKPLYGSSNPVGAMGFVRLKLD
ncbi:hypothetical protein H8M03_06535 [Sphingomonas sabuli]|uniref:Porin n=1 Tax=Sphingomonas sabuli TaxID=2764186 RepID=A0A7G9KZD1_9SPHN|nr:hypothetical protein [Sphingomonas sabuli]QNM81730.1 hypothetical protein H8M03_06535 [Sphingomonas sabuli]